MGMGVMTTKRQTEENFYDMDDWQKPDSETSDSVSDSGDEENSDTDDELAGSDDEDGADDVDDASTQSSVTIQGDRPCITDEDEATAGAEAGPSNSAASQSQSQQATRTPKSLPGRHLTSDYALCARSDPALRTSAQGSFCVQTRPSSVTLGSTGRVLLVAKSETAIEESVISNSDLLHADRGVSMHSSTRVFTANLVAVFQKLVYTRPPTVADSVAAGGRAGGTDVFEELTLIHMPPRPISEDGDSSADSEPDARDQGRAGHTGRKELWSNFSVETLGIRHGEGFLTGYEDWEC